MRLRLPASLQLQQPSSSSGSSSSSKTQNPETSSANPIADPGTKNCPCGLNDNCSPVRLASDEEPVEPQQIPARFAQLQKFETLPLKDTLEDSAVIPDKASQRLSEIEAKLQEIADQQTAIRTALASGVVGQPGAGSAMAGQSVVNVNVDQVRQVPRLCDETKWPIMHRMFVQACECWRNVRDELPGN